jgi:radical SAM protein with 4Fe4S-binding SPASM domain
VCETGAGVLKRPKEMLKFEAFQKMIDKMQHHTNSIIFYFMGEPFLNNNAYKMIKYAKEKGIFITTCTNGHFINATKLISCELDEVSFQIGGVTEESHQKYRVGSKLEEIVKNIKDVLREKALRKKAQPKVILGLIVMKHNESEIDLFYKMAKELCVDEARLLSPCVRSWQQARELLPENKSYWYYDERALNEGMLKPKRIPAHRCNWIYFSSVILANGDVVPCCRDIQGDYVMGNILKEDFINIWNNEKYRKFRETIRYSQENLKLCTLCSDFGIPPLYVIKPTNHN